MAKACAFCIHEDREGLEAALRAKQKTQQDVAKVLGVDRSCISRHMKEHSEPERKNGLYLLEKRLIALEKRMSALERGLREHRTSPAHRRF